MRKSFNRSELANIVLKLFIVVWIILIAFYHYYYVWNVYMQSDMASDLIHSYYVVKENNFVFSSNWYNSTELKTILNLDVAFSLMFRIIDNWRLVWTISCTLTISVLLVSAYFCGRKLNFSKIQCDGIVLLYLFPGSCSLLGEWTITFPAYTLYVTAAIIFLALYVDLRKSDKAEYIKYGIFFLLSFLIGMSGLRMPLLTVIPVFFTESYIWFQEKKNEQTQSFSDLKKAIISFFYQQRKCLYSAFYVFLGFVVFKKILEPQYGVAHGVPIIYRLSKISTGVVLIPMRLLQLFGARSGAQALTKMGLMATAQYFIAMCAIIAVICYFVSLLKTKGYDQRSFFSLISIFCGVITLVILCLTDMGDEGGLTGRYFAAGFWGLPFVLIAVCDRPKKYSVKRIICDGMICITVLIAGLWTMKNVNEGISSPERGYVAFLKGSGYTYGAATYWNANVTTVRTDGKIAMKSIANNENLSFYAWNQPKEHEAQDPEFILFAKNEYETREANDFEKIGEIVYSDDSYIIVELPE